MRIAATAVVTMDVRSVLHMPDMIPTDLDLYHAIVVLSGCIDEAEGLRAGSR